MKRKISAEVEVGSPLILIAFSSNVLGRSKAQRLWLTDGFVSSDTAVKSQKIVDAIHDRIGDSRY